MAPPDCTNWWYYFDKTKNKSHAKCKNCDWEKPRGKDYSTNLLKYHLENEHPQLYSQKLEAERQKTNENSRKRKLVQQNLISKNDENDPLPKRTTPISQDKIKSNPIFGFYLNVF
jgi:hypothetical protein